MQLTLLSAFGAHSPIRVIWEKEIQDSLLDNSNIIRHSFRHSFQKQKELLITCIKKTNKFSDKDIEIILSYIMYKTTSDFYEDIKNINKIFENHKDLLHFADSYLDIPKIVYMRSSSYDDRIRSSHSDDDRNILKHAHITNNELIKRGYINSVLLSSLDTETIINYNLNHLLQLGLKSKKISESDVITTAIKLDNDQIYSQFADLSLFHNRYNNNCPSLMESANICLNFNSIKCFKIIMNKYVDDIFIDYHFIKKMILVTTTNQHVDLDFIVSDARAGRVRFADDFIKLTFDAYKLKYGDEQLQLIFKRIDKDLPLLTSAVLDNTYRFLFYFSSIGIAVPVLKTVFQHAVIKDDINFFNFLIENKVKIRTYKTYGVYYDENINIDDETIRLAFQHNSVKILRVICLNNEETCLQRFETYSYNYTNTEMIEFAIEKNILDKNSTHLLLQQFEKYNLEIVKKMILYGVNAENSIVQKMNEFIEHNKWFEAIEFVESLESVEKLEKLENIESLN
jgi:hypothetical protein